MAEVTRGRELGGELVAVPALRCAACGLVYTQDEAADDGLSEVCPWCYDPATYTAELVECPVCLCKYEPDDGGGVPGGGESIEVHLVEHHGWVSARGCLAG